MLTSKPYGPWFTYISNIWKSIILSIFLISTMYILYSMQSREPLPSFQYRSLDIKTIKDHLQPFLGQKYSIFRAYICIYLCGLKVIYEKKSHLWYFYSVHLKPLLKIPKTSRDIANFRKYFLSEIIQICLKRTKKGAFLRENNFQKYNISLELFGIFQSGLRWAE